MQIEKLPFSLQAPAHPLDALFKPKTVAVIGATERAESVGRTILWNLISSPFGGTVYPVNPKRANVLGVRAYPTIQAVPDPIDLAILVTPAASVPDLVEACVAAGVKAAVVVAKGFKEAGAEGSRLEQEVMVRARRGNLRILGANSLGLMNPVSGLNATFAKGMARPGNVGFLSQSGALMGAVLDWSFRENVGFSALVSVGTMLDLDWGDLVYYLGEDPRTKAIVVYMENIGNARSFLSSAREVSLSKPIIVIKSGRTEAAARATVSHTGQLTVSDDVLDAAFRRSGVLRVRDLSEIFYMAEVLSKQPRPKGPNLTIVTNAGGPGILATDALLMNGGSLTAMSSELSTKLDGFLPVEWAHQNPIDIQGEADPKRYADTVEAVAADPNTDGVLVILAPQDTTDPTQTAEALRAVLKTPPTKPLLASWMGGADVAAGQAILNRAGIPTFNYPDTAARVFNYMWQYSDNLRSLYETPTFPAVSEETLIARQQVRETLERVRGSGRTLLTEFESKQLLAAYGIPTVQTHLAADAEEAVAAADRMGYPAVVKLNSEIVTHKAAVGGVRLNLADGQAVRAAVEQIQAAVTDHAGAAAFQGVTVQPMIDTQGGYELIVGSSPDPQFGPVLLFGAGGALVEILGDRSLSLPPLTTTLARRMMEETKIFRALTGAHGHAPVDVERLERVLVRFSQLVAEQRLIREIEINPLLAKSPQADLECSMLALDARVLLYGMDVEEADLPKLAIRPYPSRYVAPFTLTTGPEVTIRPIRPEDEPMMAHFNSTLSEASIYLRYFHPKTLSQRISHEELTQVCFIDYDREMALVADLADPQTGRSQIIGMGQLTRQHGANEAEYAILINDSYQRTGLGTELLRRLLEIAKAEGIAKVTADILPENSGMRRVSQRLGFKLVRDFEEGIVKAEIEL